MRCLTVNLPQLHIPCKKPSGNKLIFYKSVSNTKRTELQQAKLTNKINK